MQDMAVFKDLVAQLVSEYEHVVRDVGRLLGENDQLRDQHNQEQGKLQEQVGILEQQAERLRCELQNRPVVRQHLPGPPLPGADFQLEHLCEVGTQVESDLEDAHGRSELPFRPRPPRSRSGAGLRQAALGDSSRARASDALVPRTDWKPSLQDWVHKSRQRIQSKGFSVAAEAAEASPHVLVPEFAHTASQPEQKRAVVNVTVYGVTGLTEEQLQADGRSEPPRCSLVARLGREEQRLDWKRLVDSSQLASPGQVRDDRRLAVSWSDGEMGATLKFATNRTAGEVEVEVISSREDACCGRISLPIGSERQLWAMDGGGFLECEVCLVEPNNELDDLDMGPDAEDGKKARRLQHLFPDAADSKVLRPNEFYTVLKASQQIGSLPQPLTESLAVTIVSELARIHDERSGNSNPEVSTCIEWNAFVKLMLSKDLADGSSSEMAPILVAVGNVVRYECARKHKFTSTIARGLVKDGLIDDKLADEDNHSDSGSGSTFFSRCVTTLSAMSSIAVLLSFIFLGVSLDRDPDWPGWQYFEVLWAGIFLLEILTKIIHYGPRQFFCGPDYLWNWSDAILTGVAVADVVLTLLFSSDSGGNIVIILRGLRLARITRLVKIMRIPMLAELANMISGFVIGAPWLFWVLVVLFCVIYVLAVGFRSFILTVVGDAEDCGKADYVNLDPDSLAALPEGCKIHHMYGQEYCGSVLACMFTLFRCMIGDCSTASGRSLSMLLSDGFGVRFDALYSFGMIVVLFGVFNIITAVFVEATLSGLKYNDAQRKYAQLTEQNFIKVKLEELAVAVASSVRLMRGIRHARTSGKYEDVMRPLAALNSEEENQYDINMKLTEHELNTVLRSKAVRKLLASLDIEITPQSGVVSAFIVDDDGHVSMHELIAGLLRLRGELAKTDIVATQVSMESIRRAVEEVRAYTEQSQERMMVLLDDIFTDLIPLVSDSLSAPCASPPGPSVPEEAPPKLF
eukprot:TRINITY_DN36452_c0_g1_i1.p1 TRINITY_DN36452_c0_g1~~TRINITY_DN36452_c0_g1_i1.p1  ORF type:complete len:971 (+),score=164.37 TRINITY_DN36452_c0_g1_i1:19-2931(+)